MKTRLRQWVIGILLALMGASPAGAADADLWAALRAGSHAVLIRHALAPGGGDPANFQLRDCATQRNLSGEGRDQSRRMGDLFRKNGIAKARVLSSQWCRCLETARLMALHDGEDVEEFPAINSFFQDFAARAPQTRALRDWLKTADLSRPTILVTHQVNITALTDVVPASGEMVFVKRGPAGGISVVGTLETR